MREKAEFSSPVTSGARDKHELPTDGRELMLHVHRQMRVLAGTHPDLDDLTQTALEQILRSRFRGESKWTTFTHAVCYRVWLKHLRWNYRFRERFSTVEDPAASSTVESLNPEAALDVRQKYQRLYRALETVSKKRRAVVVLHDIAGIDVSEIAQIVEAKEATVRTRLRDGRRKLAEALKSDEFFGPTLEWRAP